MTKEEGTHTHTVCEDVCEVLNYLNHQNAERLKQKVSDRCQSLLVGHLDIMSIDLTMNHMYNFYNIFRLNYELLHVD